MLNPEEAEAKSCVLIIVEDDEDILEAMKDYLTDEGYRVLTAQNGQQALDLLASAPRPCIILLDLFMPVMNGLQFLQKRAMGEEEAIKAIPVIVVSAAPPDGEMMTAARKLATSVFPKPAPLDQLLSIIHQYCRRPAA